MADERLMRAAIAARKLALRGAREDLRTFIESVAQDDAGRPLRLEAMHLAWLRHVDYCWSRGLKAIIMAHFGSGKSSSLAVPLIAWHLGRQPTARVKVIANDDGNATRRVMGVARLLESASYRAVFPEIRQGQTWNNHELYVERPGHAIDPSVQARGVLGSGVGTRADVLVFDDVVDQRNSFDPAQRRKVTDVVEQTWLSRLSPEGRVLYVATPWHLDDATHHFVSRPGWCALIQRVTDDCSAIEQDVVGAGDDYPDVGVDKST